MIFAEAHCFGTIQRTQSSSY